MEAAEAGGGRSSSSKSRGGSSSSSSCCMAAPFLIPRGALAACTLWPLVQQGLMVVRRSKVLDLCITGARQPDL